MTNQELFNLLKKNAGYFSVEDIASRMATSGRERPQPGKGLRYIANMVAGYNLKTLQEIKSRDCVDVVEEVDLDLLHEFTDLIDKYLDESAPGQEDLKSYVRMISIYLTFIAKKPLHPPGMTFAGGQRIVEKDGMCYCPVRHKQTLGKLSLCKYCVSRDISEIKAGFPANPDS